MAILLISYGPDRETRDDKKIEGSGANNGGSSKDWRLSVNILANLDDIQENFRCGRPKCHECQICNCLVPDRNLDHKLFLGLLVKQFDFFVLSGDNFNGLHEDI